jgi:hypothetical protein
MPGSRCAEANPKVEQSQPESLDNKFAVIIRPFASERSNCKDPALKNEIPILFPGSWRT